jgi:ribonuclease P protein component
MLKKSIRIAKAKDWQTLYRRGRTVFGRGIVLKTLKSGSDISRFGVVVGTKVSKRATIRNRLKRQIRAIISQNYDKTRSGYDTIIITRPDLAKKAFAEIKNALEESFKKAGLIS